MQYVSSLGVRTEIDALSAKLYSDGKVKKKINSECYTPSLEPFESTQGKNVGGAKLGILFCLEDEGDTFLRNVNTTT
jgi:hypothetical protein